MRKNYDGLITFASTHQALRTEALLNTKEIDFDIRPIPPAVFAGCGLAIEFYIDEITDIIEVIDKYDILYQGLYRKQDQQFIEMHRE